MGAVHGAIVQRTSRYFRQYGDHIATLLDSRDDKKLALTIGEDIIKRGKIKKDRVPKIVDTLIRRTTDIYWAHEVIREDEVVSPSKLSANFDPVYTVVAALSPGKLRNEETGQIVEAMQISVVTSEVTKNCVTIIETNTGVQLNFHAIARLEEREIEVNPLHGLSGNLSQILTFTTLMSMVCGEEDRENFVIPYGQHLLFGRFCIANCEPGSQQWGVMLQSHKAEAKNIGNLDWMPLYEIRTAVSFDELGQDQDDLRDAIWHFADSHLDDINTMFEALYMPQITVKKDVDIAGITKQIRKDFEPIKRMSAWIRNK